MSKREFIEIDNALKAVDDRVEELKKDKQFRYSKQIDVMGVKNHFPEYPILSEQDIVKPYLTKLKAKMFDLPKAEGKTYWDAVDDIGDLIDALLSEQGDKNEESD